MNVFEARALAISKLKAIYDQHEAGAIARILCEHLSRNLPVSEIDPVALEDKMSMLLNHTPLAYVLEETWFYARPFTVNPSVLIPRPETEELVELIHKHYLHQAPRSILDIGTGSGCIAITLKLFFPDTPVTAIDISMNALETAKQNADRHRASIEFINQDFLDEQAVYPTKSYELIVSNPPYIPLGEKSTLSKHVTEFEPATALFVPDDDPLLFYKQLALFGKRYLEPGGIIFAEIHQDKGEETKALFLEKGYNTTLRRDMSGNNRFIQAEKK